MASAVGGAVDRAPDAPSAAALPPVPVAGPLTAFFWEAIAEGRLDILRCDRCGHHVHYPRPICDRCQSTELSPATMSGRGTIYSYTVVVQAFHPYFVDRLPYVLAVVELEEEPGLKVTTTLVDGDEDELRVGLPVELALTDVGYGLTLPYFRLTRTGHGARAGA
jgi:uncharacterized OB-fold protein